MTFQGEGGIDAGGLFRDSLREICAELQSEGALRLLLPCPNHRRMGGGHAKWMVNAALGDAQHLEMYRFVGAIMGASLLWEASVEIDLPALIWKQLMGQRATWADLVDVDEAFCRKVADGRAATEAEWAARQQRWVVATAAGQLAEVRRGGAGAVVGFAERGKYLDACVEFRLREGWRQIEAMREGFFSLVPALGLQVARRMRGAARLRARCGAASATGPARHGTAVLLRAGTWLPRYITAMGWLREATGAITAMGWDGSRRLPAI